jgi:uncharacterized protein (TIRG00374 family)
MATVFVWLISRQLETTELLVAFTGANFAWVFAGLLAFSIDYACRIERWRLMLTQDNQALTWQRCAGPFMSSFAANNVLPFRAGDVLRAFAFNDRLGVSSGIVVATLLVERLLDLLMVLVLLCSSLFFFDMIAGSFVGIGVASLSLVVAVILVLLLFPTSFGFLALYAGKLVEKIAPSIGGKVRNEIEKGLATLKHLSNGTTMLRLIAWSIAAWLAEGAVFWCASKALPSITNPLAVLLALPMGTLATLIPSSPGYVGTFDYFIVRALSGLGNDVPASTAFALLVHTMLWFPPTLVGGLYLLLRPTKTQITEAT